ANESAVDDFAIALLRELSYETNTRLVCSRVVLPYQICGADSHTDTNIGVLDRTQNDILHLIHKNKCLKGNPDPCAPRAQLIHHKILA
ncbi:hypothetical protein EDB85DRAFT_1811431, partial [Lactarius pseudohatsudake]